MNARRALPARDIRWLVVVLMSTAVSIGSIAEAGRAVEEDTTVTVGLKLRYDRPAADWEREALPVGNGRMGGMIFGGVAEERIQFNVDSLWTGHENPSGKYGRMGAYQAFGDLFIAFGAEGQAPLGGRSAPKGAGYRRELDIAAASTRSTTRAAACATAASASAAIPIR